MIKIDRLEAHDRLQYFKKQNFSIEECCQDLINQRPFGNYPFYIFSHARTDDDGVTKRLIWDPRLTKPRAQTNSMLFKAYPGTDLIKTIWIIPARELWGQYKKGLLTANETICQSIWDFQHNRHLLEVKENDDLSDEVIHSIYVSISQEAKRKKMMTKLYLGK
jgi:hypothetical protein